MLRFARMLFFIFLIWASSLQIVSGNSIKHRVRRLVKSEKASSKQFPWQAGLIIDGRYGSGAIITPEWIVTSAWTVKGPRSIEVFTGQTEYGVGGSKQICTEFIWHESYVDGTTYHDDIGLIKLSKPLTFNEYTKPIAIADDILAPNTAVTFSGWGTGRESDFSAPKFLQYVSAKTISNTECAKSYGTKNIYGGLTCVDSLTKRLCHGDSGDPLVANIDTDPILVGLGVWWGSTCETEAPSVFIRTAYYRGWIQHHIGSGKLNSSCSCKIDCKTDHKTDHKTISPHINIYFS